MNPIYTGKDVSFIDTKQANRAAEAAVLDAERFATFAHLLTGAEYPEPAFAKAWVQLAYGAHHDAITGSESDQVYLDLLTGWRDAWETRPDGPRQRAWAVLSRSCSAVHRSWCGIRWRTTEPISSPSTSPSRVPLGLRSSVTTATTRARRWSTHGGRTLTWVARDVPSLGWRAYRFEPGDAVPGLAAGRR